MNHKYIRNEVSAPIKHVFTTISGNKRHRNRTNQFCYNATKEMRNNHFKREIMTIRLLKFIIKRFHISNYYVEMMQMFMLRAHNTKGH